MNAQMKAVGRQAGLVFIDDGVYGQRWYSSKCGLDAAEYEKLVQAIVTECMMVVGNKTCPNYAYKAIQTHFGIEE
jgi:hypothetical protein